MEIKIGTTSKIDEQRAYNAENYPASVLTWLNEATDRAFDSIKTNEWTKTTDKFPIEDTMCIVMRIGYGITTLHWNAHYKVWDDADMDDYCCEKNDVSHWIAYPEPPQDTKAGE